MSSFQYRLRHFLGKHVCPESRVKGYFLSFIRADWFAHLTQLGDLNQSKCEKDMLFTNILNKLYLKGIFRSIVNFHMLIWTATSEFGTYRLCEQRRFRRACASAQSCQNLRCSLIQAVSQEEPSVRKPDPWPLWMAGHAQLKFVMTECSKTQIRLTGPI